MFSKQNYYHVLAIYTNYIYKHVNNLVVDTVECLVHAARQ